MAEEMNLRSAFNGFNRRDVLTCIEQLNNDHKAKLQSLQTQAEQLLEENRQLQERYAELQAKYADLQKELEAAQLLGSSDVQELETYRRAERTEREARERAARVSEQTDSALKNVDKVVADATDRLSGLMAAWMDVAEHTRSELQAASEAVGAIPHEG